MWRKIKTFVLDIYDSLRNVYFHLIHVLVIPLRYHVEVKGGECLQGRRPGLLFLSNHSSHLDATILTVELRRSGVPLSIWALDATFKLPYLRWAARHAKTVKVVKVPNINERRSIKHTSRLHKLISRTGDGLKRGKNFLIFPAGRCKDTPLEKIDGKSAVPLLVRQCPEVDIILVRITGLWGSRFSHSVRRQDQWSTFHVPWTVMLWQSIKMLLLNVIFFIPKRKVLVEFAYPGQDFPRHGTRLEICRYLENWYNAPWGPKGEPLQRVPDYFWKAEYTKHEYVLKDYQFDLLKVSKTVRNDVIRRVADKADLDCKDIDFTMHLGRDLGLDSLDLAELLSELEEKYRIKKMVPDQLSTVGHLIAIVGKIPITCEIKTGEFHQVEETVPFLPRLWISFTTYFSFT